MNLFATMQRVWAPVRGHWRWLSRATGDLVLPPTCVYCLAPLSRDRSSEVDAGQRWFCASCRRLLVAGDGPRCGRCASLLPVGDALAEDCRVCRPITWRLDAVWTLGQYEGPLRSAVLRMKHAEDEPLAAGCAELLCERHAEAWRAFAPDVIVPAPMHWRRRFVRGTNSPEAIADRLARRLEIVAAPRLLRRRRHTAQQSQLSPALRHKNVRGAFGPRRRYDIRQARVLLVDDVLTTGSTANEMAAALREAGAAAVAIAVIARAQGHD